MSTLEPFEFRTPFAKLTFRNGAEMPVIVSEVWQRRLEGFSSSVEDSINLSIDESVLLGIGAADISMSSVAVSAQELALLTILSQSGAVDYGPQIEDLRRQLAAMANPQNFSDQDLLVYAGSAPLGLPQGLNIDSAPTFASLYLLIGSFTGQFLHQNTANRVYNFPDATGNMTYTITDLMNSRLVLGRDQQKIDVLGDLGTVHKVLHGDATGDPSWGAVDLAADVSGVLPVANGGSGTSGALVDNGAYPTGWSGDTTHAPSRNAAFNELDALNTEDVSLQAQISALLGSTPYTISNVTPQRSYDVLTATLPDIVNTLGTLIADLQAKGILS